MLISKGSTLERRILGTSRGILGKIHVIFHKRKLACYANVFYLVNAGCGCGCSSGNIAVSSNGNKPKRLVPLVVLSTEKIKYQFF